MSAAVLGSGAPVSGRSRGAPVRSVAQRMGADADPHVRELADYVHGLVCAAFPGRPWKQLVGRLTEDDRGLLRGGDDRRLSGYLSAQFGSKARRGPNRQTIQIVLRHCLHADNDIRAAQSARVLQLFRAVHGEHATLLGPPRQRRGGRPQEQHSQPEALAETVRRQQREINELTARNTALQAANADLRKRLQVLENAFTPRTDVRGSDLTRLNMIRPYTLIDPDRQAGRHSAADPPEESEPEDPPPARGRLLTVSEATESELPAVSFPSYPHKSGNTPRGFPPLPEFPDYPFDLSELGAPAPISIPRQRTVARATMPRDLYLSPPPRPQAVWGTGTAGVITPEPTAIPVRFAVTDLVPHRGDDRVLGDTTSPVADPWFEVWSDGWADLLVDQLPADRYGFAQAPVLTVATALSLLIGMIPALLG